MGFREWLLKEDPDEVVDKDEDIFLDWEDGLSFCIFDGYCICANIPGLNHQTVLGDMSDCLDTVKNALAGSVDIRGVSGCIAPPDQRILRTYGKPSRRALEMILSSFKSLPDDVDSDEFDTNSRSILLNSHPDVILGRIWPDDRVVSFWNRRSFVTKNRHHVLEFVREMTGMEVDFQYELEDDMLSYDEFVGGAVKKANPLFDPSKVHTMLPGPAKTQMMGAMGFMRSKPVDVRSRAAREGD
jgi:hypothetical protein